MSLKLLKFKTPAARFVLPVIGIMCVLTAWFSAKRDVAASLAYKGLDSRIAESRSLGEWLLETAPDDPYAHSSAARYFEKTFDPDDLARSLIGYENAASRSPNNYFFWLQLGASRDRNGDTAGAEIAYGRALELAPNYAAVRWACGNSFIRHGKVDEGFALVSKAAAADPKYSDPAASMAMQAFDGNTDEVRRVLGDSDDTNAALADVLGSQKKYREALDAWSRLSSEDKNGKFKEIGQRLLTWTTDHHETRIAAAFYNDLAGDGAKAVTGQLTNGGFESGVKLRNAGFFDWQIAEGSEPQIGLSENVKRSGRYSLWLTFNSFDPAAFRTISQRVAVIPGATYEFEAFYRTDIKSNAAFKWVINDSLSTAQIAATDPLALNGDWASLKARFVVPANSDGIVITFVRTGCGGGACPVTGKISFDDISIRQL